MNRRLIRSSQRLSETPVLISAGEYDIEVFWFRAMGKTGNWFIRRHAHLMYEFHFCAQGACNVKTDASSFLLKENYFCLSSPGVYHTQCAVNEEEFIEYSLSCNFARSAERVNNSISNNLGKEVEKIFSVFTRSSCAPVKDAFGIISLFNEALDEADLKRTGFEWALHSIVPKILLASARAIEAEQAGSVNPVRNSNVDRMTAIEKYIQKNIHKEISPRDIADFMNLSEKQISRIVIARKGFPTKKFITRSKLNAAKELLVSGDAPIKEIAGRLGFSSEQYFNSVFRLHVGCPPGVFRSSMALDSGEKFPADNV